MQHLYCYVDESGQDSTTHDKRPRIFIVAVALFEESRHTLEQRCIQFERESGKRKQKWRKANRESRMTYWRLIVSDSLFHKTLCYSQSIPPMEPEFDARTILGIAKAINWKNPDADYTSDIYVDRISDAMKVAYANELRKIGVHVRKVRRLRDDNSALIRLADALAGLAREAAEGYPEAVMILRQAVSRGIISEL
jgi:Protein of unknown function (DUF3800)